MPKAKVHDIYEDTPLHAAVIADSVTLACAWFLKSDEPIAYSDRLEKRAVACYAKNPSFRKNMLARGNKGRDTLYVFMRHWLAAHMKADHPALYRRLPDSYSVGAELPSPVDNSHAEHCEGYR